MSKEPRGFRTADLDVDFFDDDKVRSLVRSTRDEALICRCLVAQLSVVAASWDKGQRATLAEAAPVWLTDLDDLRDRLARVELLDAEGRIPEESWTRRFGRAWERLLAKKEAGRLGGLAKAANRAGTSSPEPHESPSTATPSPQRSQSDATPPPEHEAGDALRRTVPSRSAPSRPEKKTGLEGTAVEEDEGRATAASSPAPFVSRPPAAGRTDASSATPAAVGRMQVVSRPQPGWRHPCANYVAHQNHHRLVDGQAVCDACESAIAAAGKPNGVELGAAELGL